MTKFKLSILTLITLFFTSSVFISCTTESNDSELVNNDTEQLKIFLNQNYDTSKSNFEVLDTKNEIQTSSDFMNGVLARDNGTNYESFYMQIDSNGDDGIVEFNSVTTDITSDGINEFFTTYTEFSNESGYTATYQVTFKKLSGDEYEIVDYNVLSLNGESSSVANRGWFSDYGDCIGGVLDTDESLGQVITVLGIAGGAGCVPCGIAGGVIFGFAALGCTAV